MTPSDQPLGDLERDAERVLGEIQRADGSLEPAYASLEVELNKFRESGLPIEAILPAGEIGLGFRLRKAQDARSFWEIYKGLIRQKVCSSRSELRKHINAATSGAAGAIVGWIITALALPAAAAAIAVPVAAIIASLGIDAFCEYQKEHDHGPKRT